MDITPDITVDYPKATLVKAKHKWYAQVTVPPELRSGFNGRKQVRRSTATTDRREAERKLHASAEEIYAEFDEKAKAYTALSNAAAELEPMLPRGQCWARHQWQHPEALPQAIDDVRGRAMAIFHYPMNENADPEDQLGLMELQGKLELPYWRFEDAVTARSQPTMKRVMPISDAAKACFESHSFERIRTRRDYERGVQKFIQYAGDLDIGQITARDGNEFAENLGQSIARKTLQRDVGAVRLILAHATEKGWLPYNPFSGLRTCPGRFLAAQAP